MKKKSTGILQFNVKKGELNSIKQTEGNHLSEFDVRIMIVLVERHFETFRAEPNDRYIYIYIHIIIV